MKPEQIINDPRWDDAPIALYDSLIARYGQTEANRIWMLACRLCDALCTDDA